MIVHLIHQAEDQGMLFTNWGNYFNRLQNPAVQIPRIGKNCPKLYAVMTGDDKDGVHEMEVCHEDGVRYHGFALQVPVDKDAPLYTSITQELLDKVMLLVTKNIAIYNELKSNPPFPAWKDGLQEVWN